MPTATLSEIRDKLPKDSDTLYGWDDAKISIALIRNGNSLPQTMRDFWFDRWSNTTEYVDVEEPEGVKRKLSQIHAHAKEQLDYWNERVDAENIDTSTRRPISFGNIERPTG